MAPNAAQPPLLRDVIDIKPSISTSDFVLKLAEAVTEEGTARALQDYVVTERLLENFDEALNLIKAALDGHTSKAAYLHGSFGSGKSHFMAVLHALLRGDPAARARQDFDPLLARHAWLGGSGGSSGSGSGGGRKRFLLVPYHMLGAKSLEQRVLGGYVAHVRQLHPEAPTPQVYRTDSLFADVRQLRAKVGDERFIAGLGDGGTDGGAHGGTDGGAAEDDEWGEGFVWTPELLDIALDAEELTGEDGGGNLVHPTAPAELRAKLVHDATTGWFPGFAQHAAEDEHGFVSLDAGLAVIARHAKSLGYDGLILFLDELILWLANRIHDQKFVSRETDKITNFVEGADSRRAIPVVSFIARQRDLRELVGEEVSGAAETAIQDSLKLASGRFDQITLEDRNLPQIAHARLLKPKDEQAAAAVDAAFAKAKRSGGPQVWDVLLGSDEGMTGADEESFRLTYPFSPAFMDTLVHISSALQRSRTGLKLMGQLLADHREDAHLEQLIPLGDLYPVIADGGDRPFVDSLKAEFQAADKLYRTKLRPYLLGEYEITEEDVERWRHRPGDLDPQVAQRCRTFTGDNRLICTLLLSALAPSVPALRDLTIRRLGALNHGSVVTPIPGAEIGVINSKVQAWATRFPEIKPTGGTANPGVRLELTGVDVDSVLANANVNDNRANRRALAKRLLADALGLQLRDRLGADELHWVWRGSHRTVEVVFGNIADQDDLPDHDFVPSQDGLWRFIVDLPYDEGEYGPREDSNRITGLRAQSGTRPRTVAWVPTHLSAGRFQDFRRLVTIDYALADQRRFDTQYASHLNADNRARARALLEGQRESLTKTVQAAFKQAYGLAEKKSADVALGFDEHVQPLPDVPELRPSLGQSLHDAVRHVAGKVLAHQFPAHPELDPDRTGTAVKAADARAVFAQVRAAAEAADRRVEVPAAQRELMRRVAQPLGLGQQKEAYFELSTRWADHFHRQARAEGHTGDLGVVRLTEWLDRPEPMGLEPFLAHLVIAAFAEVDDRVWVRGGALLDPAPEPSAIKPQDALRAQPLPSETVWAEAGRRFEEIFGGKPPTLRRGRMVGQFARQITDKAREHQPHAADLVRELERHAELLGLDATGGADGTDEPNPAATAATAATADAAHPVHPAHAAGGTHGPEGADRLALARRSLALLDTLLAAGGTGVAGGTGTAGQVIKALAGFDLAGVSASRYGASIVQAKPVAGALANAPWDMLKLAAGYGPEGEAVLAQLRAAARSDQRTAGLPEALAAARSELVAVMERRAAAPPTATGTAAPGGTARPDGPDSPADRGAGQPSGEAGGPPGPDAVSLTTPSSHPQVPTSHARLPGEPARSGGGRTTAARAAAELRAELAQLAEQQPDTPVEIRWWVAE